MPNFTFVCLTPRGVATVLDLQDLPAGGERPHAQRLLAEHASAERVEIWQAETLSATVSRGDGAGG